MQAKWIAEVRSHLDAGRLREAEAMCRAALQAGSEDADALYLLGLVGLRADRPDGAAACFRRATELRPGSGEFFSALAGAMFRMNRIDEAEAAYRHALQLTPSDFHAWHNLAVIDERRGRLLDAAAHFSQAVRLWPNNPLAHLNLGTILRDVGELDAATHHFERAIQLQPDLADAHMGLAWLRLLRGDFARGWPEYEWRWRCPGFQWPQLSQPVWDGSALNGRTILLHAEQGLGDTIHFVRYAPLLAAQGGNVVVFCARALQRVASTVPGVSQVVCDKTQLPAFDVWCPLLSLPMRCKTTLENIPAMVPYVTPDPARVASWSDRLKNDPPGIRVGICWAGNPTNINDENRSIPPALLAPLSLLSNITLYSLQVAPAGAAGPAIPFRVVDHTRFITDFADTAALIAHLDLIISVDTAVAHLAGALGKPVWAMLRFAPDFRWLLDRTDTPWYPTMRLFRKKPLEPWPPLIDWVAGALGEWVTRPASFNPATPSRPVPPPGES